jgi:hypothetical protein
MSPKTRLPAARYAFAAGERRAVAEFAPTMAVVTSLNKLTVLIAN